jgi:hypothetical protein
MTSEDAMNAAFVMGVFSGFAIGYILGVFVMRGRYKR